MKKLRNIMVGLCLCAGTGIGMAAFNACTPAQQNNGTAADTVQASHENAVVEAIMSRRSIRKYKDTPVEREKLQTLVECGINAPSAMNRQPWQVRVVDNAEYINGITELFKKANPKMAEDKDFKNMFRNAPAVIFVASPADGSGQPDCGLLGENIMLAAQSMGLGTCCLGGPTRFVSSAPEAKPYLDRLQLPEDYTLLYAIAVGYPDESPEAKPRDAEKIKFVE